MKSWGRAFSEGSLGRGAKALAALRRLLQRSRLGRFLLELLAGAAAVVRGFRGEKISLRASALTYISMLSLVPLLAVAFAIVRALGVEGLRQTIHEFVFANLAPGAREQIGGYLDEFVNRASAGAVGSIGGGFLLLSALSLLHNIERSLNDIWGVNQPRPLLQRALIYWAVLTVGPVALGLSLLASDTMRRTVEAHISVPGALLSVVPLATTVLLFAFLYIAAPNARVSWRAAFGGALVGGGAWEIAKHAYTLYAAKSFRYNAIYGSVGAIPLFLLWVFVSWLLVLFGARLAYALQYATGARIDARLEDARARELLCAQVALAAAADFLEGAEPPSAAQIARRLEVESAYVDEAIRTLGEGGLLARANNGGVVPTRPPEQIRLLDIARAAQGTLFAHGDSALSQERGSRSLRELFEQADRAGRESLARVDLAALARPLRAPQPSRQAKEGQ